MYYFIPAWHKADQFEQDNRPWHATNVNEYDDTISQLGMFSRETDDIHTIVLDYSPQLLSFLHRQCLHHIHYESVFDRIQDIHEKAPGLFSYKDLKWDDDITWISTPFVMAAMKDHQLHAIVDFNKDGFMYKITYYQDQKIAREEYYDDRGFLSSTWYASENYQEFYNDAGISQFQLNKNDGTIIINPEAKDRFEKESYASMSELISEFLLKFKAEMNADDVIIYAASHLHNQLVQDVFKDFSIAASIDGKRKFAVSELKDVQMIVCEHEYQKEQLENEAVLKDIPIYQMPPRDTRFTLGTSQRIKELKIFIPVETMDDLSSAGEILSYMKEQPLARLYIGLYNFSEEFENQVRESISSMTDFPIEEEKQDELSLESEPRIFIEKIKTASDLIRVLSDVRIVTDLRAHSDILLQMACISTGIPMIVDHQTEYVRHMKNGLVLSYGSTLKEALRFYLDNLNNWNEALVYCYEMINKYRTDDIVKKWKVILNESKNRRTADR